MIFLNRVTGSCNKLGLWGVLGSGPRFENLTYLAVHRTPNTMAENLTFQPILDHGIGSLSSRGETEEAPPSLSTSALHSERIKEWSRLAAALKTRSTQVIRLPLCGKTDKLRGAVAGRLWGFVRLRPSVRLSVGLSMTSCPATTRQTGNELRLTFAGLHEPATSSVRRPVMTFCVSVCLTDWLSTAPHGRAALPHTDPRVQTKPERWGALGNKQQCDDRQNSEFGVYIFRRNVCCQTSDPCTIYY